MAKETYIVNCWSVDVNTTVAVYESFGWELVSNNISTTVQASYDTAISAENELTFSREKSMPWYNEVCKLQMQYDELQGKINSIEESEPEEKKPSTILAIILLFCYFIPGIVYYYGYKASQKNKVKKWHAENDAVLANLKSQQVTILNQSRAVIEGEG